MISALLAIFCLALILAMVTGFHHSRIWLGLNSLAALCGLAAATAVLATGEAWDWRCPFAVGGEYPLLRLDGISALFLALVCLIGGLGAVYAREYWSEDHFPLSAPRGRCWWNALVLSMGLVLTCGNGLHFLFAWEAFALSAYFLITLDNDHSGVRKSGWLYLAASHAGTMVLFAFFTALAARTGTWELGPVQGQAGLAPLFWLALAGFGVKAGAFPLHIWLPSAHAGAPSHVSAIMSAVAIKMGVYGIVRFSGWLPLPPGAGWVVLGIGCASALTGIAFALAQNDIKRLLAYCSVENIGIILTGLGLSLLAVQHGRPAWGQAALAGTFLHIVNHCLFKSLLFFGAGSVLHATGTRDMSRLGGLWRRMPWTACLFALGAAAVAGLPPLNGFVSEWAIYLGLLRAAAQKGATAGVLPATIVLAGAGALALAAFAKAGSIVFLGAPRTKIADKATECGPLMRAPMVVLGGLVIAIGLMPALFFRLAQAPMAAWAPQWAGAIPQLPTRALGGAHTILFCVLLAAGVLMLRVIRRNGSRRGLTWDCGYAAPTAHMQYTSGSFAGIAGGWFAWLLRPENIVRRIRGLFPTKAMFLQRIPETVLEMAVLPAARATLFVADGAKRMQHGRLHLYILYVFLGVTALGLLVYQGGR
jgi:hydrogenase-4 component B